MINIIQTRFLNLGSDNGNNMCFPLVFAQAREEEGKVSKEKERL